MPSGSSSEAAASFARTVSKVPAQARIIARIIDKIFSFFDPPYFEFVIAFLSSETI